MVQFNNKAMQQQARRRIGAAYARFSTDRQCSIDVQFAVIDKYVEANNIYIPPENRFYDEALSGMSKRRRRDFQALIELAASGGIDCVVVYDTTRGAHDVVDWFTFRKEMMQLNVEVLSATNKLGNLDDPGDFISELVTVGVGHMHVLTSRMKSMDKIDYLAAQGLFCGGHAPLGYTINEQKGYEINEDEAQFIRTIFTMYADGFSYDDILKALPADLEGRRGKAIGKNTLHYILKNERYIGRYSWNKRKVKYMGEWTGGGKSERAVMLDGIIPPIMDMETWEKVTVRRMNNKKNKKNHSRKDRVYLLSGLIRCGYCGNSFVGTTTINKKGYEYKFYACGEKVRTKKCKAKNISAAEVETLVCWLLRQSILDGSMIEETADAILAAGANKNKASDVGALRSEKEKLQVKVDNLIATLESGLDSESVRTRVTELETKRRLLEEKIKALKPKATLSRDYLIRELSQDIELLKEDPNYIQGLIQKYIVEVKIYDDAIEISSTADLTMRMTVPEDWTVINGKDPEENLEVLGTNGCGGRI